MANQSGIFLNNWNTSWSNGTASSLNVAIQPNSPFCTLTLASVWIASTTASITTPSGWAKPYDSTGHGSMRQAVYWLKGSPSNAATSVTFSFSSSVQCFVIAYGFSGVDSDNPILAVSSGYGATSGTSMAMSSFSTSDGTGAGVYLLAAKPTTSASSTGFSSITNGFYATGNGRTTSSSGYIMQGAIYGADTDPNNANNVDPIAYGLQTSTTVPACTLVCTRSSPWAATTVVLRAAQNRFFTNFSM